MRRILSLAWLLLYALTASAQDALDLPAPLYVLLNEGQVQRYGLGAEGIRFVTPEDRFVLDFGVAPNGDWLAYRTETELIVRDMAGDMERVLDTAAGVPPVRGEGETVAWAPGGDALAVTTEYGGRIYLGEAAATIDALNFTPVDVRESPLNQWLWSPDGRYLAAEAAENVWWIYRREAGTMVLSSALVSAVGAAFVTNTELVFAPEAGGLTLMDLANANEQIILLDDTWNYALPFMLPEGMLGVFGRQKVDPDLELNQGRLLGLKAGVAEINYLSEAPLQLDALRWAPSGAWLVSFSGGVFALVDPLTGQTFALPIAGAVAYSWGPISPES
ncbi:MAG: hypothetical protein K8I30_01325 [Anaerolineae bacterium]|nr:hypothetical protein [Anaerolineae bacterium]